MGTNPAMLQTPPLPPSVASQQGSPGPGGPFAAAAMGAKEPTEAIATRLIEVVQRLRGVIPMISQEAPEAMIYINRSMEALNMAVSAMQAGKNPAQGSPGKDENTKRT